MFGSAKHSIWPIYLSIVSLPPHLRMRKDFIMLAGVWFGPTKPDMEVILKPVLEEIDRINALGLDVETPSGGKIRIRVKLLLSVFDLPAKSMAVNMKQFNGRYGCLYCEHPGETLFRGCLIYKPDVRCSLRTHSTLKVNAETALESGQAEKGIKGPSVLSPYLNVVDDIPVDYMHAVLEGVIKQIMCMWFNSKHHKSSFYMGTKVKAIDRLLLKIKPPSHFRRSPRPIQSTLKFWKANEYRAWLLFYSLPVVQKFLPSEYVHHWSLLVFSVHVLLQSEIDLHMLPVAEEALRTFYCRIPDLYGLQACTADMHSLSHLTAFVKKWGPLWGYSLFGFENMNGHIKKMFHGTGQVIDQLVFCVKAEQSLYFQVRNGDTDNTSVANFLSKYKDRRYDTTSCFLGKSKKVVLPNAVHDALQRYTGTTLENERNIVSRLRKNGIVFESEYFLKSSRVTDSCVCRFSTRDGGDGIGRILLFDANLKVAVVRLYVIAHDASVVSSLRRPTNSALQTVCQRMSGLNSFFSVVQLPGSALFVVSITEILNACVSVKTSTTDAEIIVSIPNDYEMH